MKGGEKTGVERLRGLIRDIPDFPKPGIVFKDITPLLADPAALGLAFELMAQPFRGQTVTRVVGIESRGFIFASALAHDLSAGFIPVRKPGRLPSIKRSEEYELEYGSDCVEIHEDAIGPEDRVLLADDLLATGGTMAACRRLVESLGSQVVGVAVLIELAFLHGRRRLPGIPVHSVLVYDHAD
jgi:adenine phosphoribosyltransferase